MLDIPLSLIVIPENRFRRDFDAKKLLELKESILRNGLLNPITVETSGANYTLRAGERRLRVLTEILRSGGSFRLGRQAYAGDLLPAVDFAELTVLQRLEIEVEENCVRADFTWQERNRAFARLHELRSAQNPAQTVAATASEILGKPAVGDQRMAVSDAIIINKHLDRPEVAKAKNEKEALKIIRKSAEAVHRAKLAKTFDASKSPHTLLKGDSLELLRTLPAGSFDVILTDPPYGVGADNFGSMAATGHDYEDSKKYWEECMAVLPDESYRVAKERAHAYIFCDPRNFERLATLMVLANWTVFPTPIIWDKCGSGMLPFPEHGPRRTYEQLLFAYKGDRKTLMVKSDIIRISAVKNLRHGAQKPVALYEDLLGRSAMPGDRVLDCFAGTGPLLVAANRRSLVATLIEKAEDAYNIALSRVFEREIDDGAIEEDGLQDVGV